MLRFTATGTRPAAWSALGTEISGSVTFPSYGGVTISGIVPDAPGAGFVGSGWGAESTVGAAGMAAGCESCPAPPSCFEKTGMLPALKCGHRTEVDRTSGIACCCGPFTGPPARTAVFTVERANTTTLPFHCVRGREDVTKIALLSCDCQNSA